MKKLSLLFLNLLLIGMISTKVLFGQNTGDFRSAASNNWNTLSTWETYNGTTWVAAASIPDSNNVSSTNAVTILNTHNVTITDSTIAVRNVTVNQGGTLTINGGKFFITQGYLTVNGILTLTGTGSNTSLSYAVNSVSNPTAGTITIGATGVVNYSQTQTAAIKGGLPVATWVPGSTLNITSTGGPSATGWNVGGAQNFSNINWNCAIQTANFGWGFTNHTISGNVSVSNTGGSTNRMQFFGGSNGTLNITGDLIVSGSANVSTNGTSSVTHDTVNVHGNVSVNTTGDFSVSKGSQGSPGDTTGSAIFNFYGDVSIVAGTMSNSFKNTSGGGANQKFVFKKQGTQNLFITVPTASTGNITPIEVVAGTILNLQSTVNVSTLYLSGGIIVSTTSNPLVMGWWNGSAISGGTLSPISSGSSTSYVSGPMTYLYATAATQTSKTFPIGKGGFYRPLTLQFTQTAATLSSYTAELFNSAPPSNTLGTLNDVSSSRYYTISEGAGGSAFTAGTVKLSYNTEDGVINTANLRVAQGPSAGGGAWVNLGGTGSGSPAGTINSTINFTDLSNTIFTLANLKSHLTLTAFLEGYCNAGGTAMTSSPTVKVELHNSTAPYAMVDSISGTLNTSGVGTFSFANAVDGTSYYIAVKFWNTIETWSAAPQSFTTGTLSYDFTSLQTSAYLSNMKQAGTGTKWCIFSGDVNQDSYINLGDYNLVNNDSYNLVHGAVVTDLTGDLFTNLADYNIVNNNSYNLIKAHTPLINPSTSIITPMVRRKNDSK